MESKREIRKRVLSVRDALTREERMISQNEVNRKILEHPWFHRASSVLVFISFGSEIDTGYIIEMSFQQGKKVYVPKIIGDTMIFIRIYQGEALTESYKGILEPPIKNEKDIFRFEKEDPLKVLMIMPGVAFDSERNRIGYGKGFYDRYLSDKENLNTIAIGFDCQMVSVIESDSNDIKPDEVICC